MRVLVAYASKHGSTRGIAERIASRLQRQGLRAEARAVDNAGELAGYDAFAIGGAVYFGKWMKEVTDFVHDKREVLGGRPLWLFSAGPLGDQPRPAPPPVGDEGALRVRDHHVFYGALDVKRLSLVERLISKAVNAPAGDFRDWTEVDGWADGIAESLSNGPAEATEQIGATSDGTVATARRP